MFTHTARYDADTVYPTTDRNEQASIADRLVPHAVFIDPEVGSVGLAEPDARAAGDDIAIGTQTFDGVAKARAIGQTIGLIKFIVDHATDDILGCHIAGPHGGDLVHEAALAVVTGATCSDIGAMYPALLAETAPARTWGASDSPHYCGHLPSAAICIKDPVAVVASGVRSADWLASARVRRPPRVGRLRVSGMGR